MPPILSIIIPTLDEELALADTLNAVGAQQTHSWTVEIIVTDGGSLDATTAIAQQLGATVLHSQPGRGQQLHTGAVSASGEVLLFLHADVILPSDALVLITQALERADVEAGCFQVIHQCSDTASVWTNRFIRLADRRSRTRALPYGDQALFCTRALYERVGGIPQQELMEDVAFARALGKHGKIARIERAVRTGARRFEKRPVRTTLCWWTFPLLTRLGVSPRLLARIYRGPDQPR